MRFNSVWLNPKLYAIRTGASQNVASLSSRFTCTWIGSFRSLEKKKNRYGPLCRTVGLTEGDLASFSGRRPIVLIAV